MATTVHDDSGARPGYGQLLRTRGAWTFLLPGFLARQPFAMLTIGILLLVQHTTGSYTTAGAVSATAGVSMALFAPQGGKLADRFGQAAVLIPGVIIHAAAISLLISLALSGAPLWALFAAAVPAGASTPQIGPMVRARWAAKLTGTPLMGTSAAFESVTDEFTFVIGPVLATALCTGVHPSAGLVAEAVLTLVGGLLFAAQRGTQPQPGGVAGTREKGASALSVPGVRVLICVFLGIGSVFGGMQMSLTAFTESIGQPGINGLLYGAFAAGNMGAGIVCGTVAWRSAPQRRLLFAYPLLTLATTPLWSVQSVPLLGGLGLLVGLCIAPSLINGYTLVESLVPANARTEAFTWLTGAVGLGQAAGSTVAGRLVDKFSAHTGFLVPLGGTALALLVLLTLRKRLTPVGGGTVVAQRGVGHRDPVSVD
ncbi:MFS transporter [Streptomyces orinoci]|uniref:MFS transporter n=1 Tax=Streptomyces orinoci TaxID=67339 RepID=A0ABV3K067_STRON|nr:MFS transporter [Streptomyces orinoci]